MTAASPHVIVTGASGGIGEAVVRRLAGDGFSVAAVGREETRLVEKFGDLPSCSTITADVSEIQTIPSLIKDVVETLGPVRGLVHCAGFDKLSPLYLSKPADAERLFRVHAVAAMTLCSQIGKRGVAAEGCSIVLVSSLAAHEGAAGHSAYAAAKGALEGFLRPAAAELAPRGIRINMVVPGIVETEMSAGFLGRMTADQRAGVERDYPLGLGRPQDVADAVAFFVRDDSRWVTGASLLLDGGHLARSV